MPHDRTEQGWRAGVGLGGVALLLLGGLVCYGWIVHSTRLVQVHPDLAAMKFNSALCFALLGLSIVLWANRKAAASMLATGACLLLSGAELAQFALGVSLGVDTLFVRPFTHREGEIPGRISVYTSASFVALSLAMLVQEHSRRRVWALMLVFTVSACVQVLTSAGLIGYASGFRLPNTGGTNMAVHTALGLLVASWAVLGANWPTRSPRPGALVHAVLVMPVAATIFALVLLGWIYAATPLGGARAPEQPVWPVVAVLAVVASLVAAALLLARVGFVRAAAFRAANETLVGEIAQREELESQQRLLVRELDHRVRNTLAQVLSLADSTARGAESLHEFNAVFGERIRALSRAHSVLANNRWTNADLGEFLSAVLEPFVRGEHPPVHLSGDAVSIPARASTPLCMVYYELAANAARHGALSTPGGHVEVTWRRIVNGAAAVEIGWREHGGPPVPGSPREGFGVSLIRTMVPHELGGTTDLKFLPSGVECVVRFVIAPPTAVNAGPATSSSERLASQAAL